MSNVIRLNRNQLVEYKGDFYTAEELANILSVNSNFEIVINEEEDSWFGAAMKELRKKYATQKSVTGPTFSISERDNPPTDGENLYNIGGNPLCDVLFLGLLGFEPPTQSDGIFRLRPQLGDLQGLETDLYTVHGPIHFKSQLKDGVQQITIVPPANVKLSVIVPAGVNVKTATLTAGTMKDGWREMALTPGVPTSFRIPSNDVAKEKTRVILIKNQ